MMDEHRRIEPVIPIQYDCIKKSCEACNYMRLGQKCVLCGKTTFAAE